MEMDLGDKTHRFGSKYDEGLPIREVKNESKLLISYLWACMVGRKVAWIFGGRGMTELKELGNIADNQVR